MCITVLSAASRSFYFATGRSVGESKVARNSLTLSPRVSSISRYSASRNPDIPPDYSPRLKYPTRLGVIRSIGNDVIVNRIHGSSLSLENSRERLIAFIILSLFENLRIADGRIRRRLFCRKVPPEEPFSGPFAAQERTFSRKVAVEFMESKAREDIVPGTKRSICLSDKATRFPSREWAPWMFE